LVAGLLFGHLGAVRALSAGCWPAAWPFGCGSGAPRLPSCKASAIISGNAAAFQGRSTLSHSA